MNQLIKKHFFLIVIASIFIIVVTIISVLFGTKDISFSTVLEAFVSFDEENVDHQIVRYSRVPRAIAVLFIGGFLAVSGAIMQGITRNYLASPTLMGINDGSSFLITLAIVFVPNLSNYQMILISMIGSALGASLVFGFGSLIKNGLSPIRLAIIGTIIGTFLSSVASAIAMYFQVSQTVAAWYNTKVQVIDPNMLYISIPFGIIGLAFAMTTARAISITSLGEDVAVSLGQKTKTVKLISILSVVLLTGTAVALVGKISFIGLVIPHVIRFIVGEDYRYIIPYSLVFGAFFLSLCDLISRYLNFPYETPIGVVTAMIGVPFFLYLIRTRGGGKHA
ncbi:FecCD family ABC transporter permease [Fervidibacillus albus]|uniref:Iron ABC transporter permease n=1 Tax=Fervidibacillus albus TaxID=2980026 RepID=A0A9E8LT88_9BACI|nr:iron ABC transporter permease [Fervidibacillus albus]WAA09184.1 iron ABC transporter permease [Fervidibacillus albus]